MVRGFVALFLLGWAPSVCAQSVHVLVETFDLSARSARSAEDYANAQPFPLPRVAAAPVSPASLPRSVAGNNLDAGEASDEAAPPALSGAERRRFATVLFDRSAAPPRASRGPDPQGERVGDKAWGEAGFDFTSSRLIPRSAAEVFPYSAVGKLYFAGDEGLFVCSGVVIAQRLVLTAAHCVHGGPDVGFFRDFQFAPAYRKGLAPFGLWDAEAAFVTDAWAGSGEMPHPQDWALLQMADRGDATIGAVAGKLTYRLYRLADNHLHLLGYPGNLDDGEQMRQVTSGDWFDPEDGTVIYGSDMSGGSSGGPWVQNFSHHGSWQSRGVHGKRLAVVGVTSYGFEDESFLVQGASVLTQDFETLRQEACANQAGNC